MWIYLAAVLLIIYVISSYNSLVVLRERVKNAWAQVDVQLNRRYELIPNLVSTIKGYAEHENKTLDKVTKARAQAMRATTTEGHSNAEGELTSSLKSLVAIAENYPLLKADKNFKELQQELSDTEDKIAFARQFFNDTTQRYNIKVQMFPTNIIANVAGFKTESFFSVEFQPETRRTVNIDFRES